jgi:hypothetical protein
MIVHDTTMPAASVGWASARKSLPWRANANVVAVDHTSPPSSAHRDHAALRSEDAHRDITSEGQARDEDNHPPDPIRVTVRR